MITDRKIDQPYLEGLHHGRFSENTTLAEAINAVAPVYELPYRGELIQVAQTTAGSFGRTSVLGTFPDDWLVEQEIRTYGVLRETWFGDQASRWVEFPNPATAAAWARTTVVHWLEDHSGDRVDQHFAVWRGQGWTVEIDRYRQRYTVAVGMAPGVSVDVFDAAADALPGERQEVTTARAWDRLLSLMPVGPTDWPWSMADEYRWAQAAAARLVDQREREFTTAELADEMERAAVAAELAEASAAPAPAAVEPSTAGWWPRFITWLTALLRNGSRP
ncbi:hypothetical protein ACIGZJ_36110 [Kitasatospora sp. NPDC052868]|uniref:hypothetical protein n=1 Tax=Kitasatospora sp. NPDC052868 TaxID=3364060 RepID=UPI0037C6C00D